MKVQHEIKATGDVMETLCGRVIAVNGAGAPCKACARVQSSKDAWSGKAQTVTIATSTTEESIAMLEAINEQASVVAELTDTPVARYLVRTYGLTAQEASDAVRDHADIVSRGERLGSYAYFIGDAVAEAWSAARNPRATVSVTAEPFAGMTFEHRDPGTGYGAPDERMETVLPDGREAGLSRVGDSWGWYIRGLGALDDDGRGFGSPEAAAADMRAKAPNTWNAARNPRATVAVNPGDTVYRDRDGAQGIVRDVLTSGDVDVAFVDGSGWIVNPSTLMERGFEIIPASDMSELTSSYEPTRKPRGFRKVKNTRSARARRGGK